MSYKLDRTKDCEMNPKRNCACCQKDNTQVINRMWIWNLP